ncbi:MAG TPA: PAS domain-containing sensor histidine kinase [Deltaproteobacteria bacterium]|nr:MAG: PAS domain-containing sensor histidine kinase [Deltaproteobacteria bacterium GWA2_55_82]OGQ63300.1 MAG: PAS domain-containing sensor histidine kinase [Deltaproteobacteria bacterium RIFCSPLOWO2_02_FULL_55_12]OIJ73136.1 MAG: PAS domain-containing sensor histidine kinase [Deltaproteobacteria bacterium GWC2_55_46]HBG45611.1 PAS domain-containing sensor histidine kinase [Deltaproteobacteria bacterium]HCY10442.1 PAS domain-containing sensor histidine kinase [Deltaproteobacteria bacterium]
MNDNQKIEGEAKRRRRELLIILLVVPAIIILTLVESHVSTISGDVPIATNILIFGLINLNIILLILLVFLILRNMVKLFIERKSQVMGSRLRTKLVTAFVSLSIVPTVLLFVIVIGFINRSIDGWFGIKVEDSLQESLELAQNYYKDINDRVEAASRIIAVSIVAEGFGSDNEKLERFINRKLVEGDFSTIEIYSASGDRVLYSISDKINQNMVPDIAPESVVKALAGEASSYVQTMQVGDVVRAVAPVQVSVDGMPAGAVVVNYYVPLSLIDKMKEISAAFEGYKQLKLLKNPVKASYFTILLIITLLIVFFSIWIGRYLAKELTVPIHELAEGTHAVASGNLDYRINVESNDEIGLLVKSFNRMTEDLKTGKGKIETANLDLRRTNMELEQRRRYIEIVLGNVPAGVVSIDKSGRIVSINRVAAQMLGTGEDFALGKNYREVLRQEDREVLREMIREMTEVGLESLEKQMRVEVDGKVMTVLANLNALKDESGNYLGMVAVLDDLTHLLKTQRMSAWKEVARRIAHEIKNPLTPIKLSAQRLRKKYLDRFPEDDTVFDECTMTIIKQVDELKTLVNEFSSFARMPAANRSPNDLNEVIREAMALYKPGRKTVQFESSLDDLVPVLDIDRDQIKRVLINLIDNALAAMGDEGTVRVETHFLDEMQLARIEVIDTGEGIPAESKQKLFEPYFSTKKTGTGLGLAIVNNIIADHNGYIRVRDNQPKGTRFVIELPVKAINI